MLHNSVVFVLTTSDSETDRSRAYHELIAGYMVKSVIGPQFVHLSSMLHEYAGAVCLISGSARSEQKRIR